MPITIPLHDDLKRNKAKYERIRALVENDEDEFASETFCIPLPNEPFNARRDRIKFFVPSFNNITNSLLGATRDAIFKEEIRYVYGDEDHNPLSLWSEDVTLGGDKVTLKQYTYDTTTIALRAYGTVFTLIDKPQGQFNSYDEELKYGMPYLNNISPLSVLNFEMANNELIWFAYKVTHRPIWENPTSKMPDPQDQIRIWTKDSMVILSNGEQIDEIPHTFGFVPVIIQSFFLPPDEDTVIGVAPFFNSSNQIIVANNMKNVSDQELRKHGGSLLLMHEQGLSDTNIEVDPAGNPHGKSQDPEAFNIFTWSGEHKPEYLVKDLQSVEMARNSYKDYLIEAVENERTMKSILKKGIDGGDLAESGIAKAMDSMPIQASLKSTADDLQTWSIKVLGMVSEMLNADPVRFDYNVEFPKHFEFGNKIFNERLDEIAKMQNIGYPSVTGMKEALKSMTENITGNTELIEQINTEIDNSDFEDEITKEVDKEINDDMDFEKSLEGMPDEEKQEARLKRKLGDEING